MIAAALDSRLDHVAIAVGDLDRALAHWADTVGGGFVAREANDSFHSAQVRFAGGGKLELLAPPDRTGAGFVAHFLDRFGPAIHHVTLTVPDIGEAIDTVRAGGYDVVDVQAAGVHWREGFLRPSQVGGLVVQVAWTSEGDDDWARRLGFQPRPPAGSAPRLVGPTLAHPDLSAARTLWTLLGAQVDGTDDRIVCRWIDSPLDVVVERGAEAGPIALRFDRPVPPAAAAIGSPPVVAG